MPNFIFIQQISVLNILNMLYNLHFFSSKCRLFRNTTLFGFCITHILNTECAKIWNKRSVAKSLMQSYFQDLANGDSKYCCMSEEMNPVRSNPQHNFYSVYPGNTLTHGIKPLPPAPHGLREGLISATERSLLNRTISNDWAIWTPCHVQAVSRPFLTMASWH